LTRFTVTFGYCFSNAVTMSLTCGAHAHTVIEDFCWRAAAMLDADADVEAAGVLPEPLGEPVDGLLEHAAPVAVTARPSAAAAMARRRLPRKRASRIIGYAFPFEGVGTEERVEV
jgi:hypothetical protein